MTFIVLSLNGFLETGLFFFIFVFSILITIGG